MEAQELTDFCALVAERLGSLFEDLCSGISAREDSRAFGAMIERRITDNWAEICSQMEAEAVVAPGRRTIYDFGCTYKGNLLGFDVKTKDLDKSSYSDGGVCAVGNLLKFIANDRSIFIVVEFGHEAANKDPELRDLEYIKVAPFHMLPEDIYRIENLGTGQVRLNYTIKDAASKINWNRTTDEFLEIFTSCSIEHYERVIRVAEKRAESMRVFRNNGFKGFKFR